jgi:transcriptional regulator with PAS, ATPase and Fis domain
LPNWKSSALPALTKSKEEKTFENEREILYQVLFDMKKDMSDLRRLVKEIIDKQGITIDENINLGEQDNTVTIQWDKDNQDTLPNNIGEIVQDPVPAQKKTINKRHIEDTEEYVEESLSLEEAEKEMIKKALDRHNGKRKLAAKDLDISERTLYRKIKQLGLE